MDIQKYFVHFSGIILGAEHRLKSEIYDSEIIWFFLISYLSQEKVDQIKVYKQDFISGYNYAKYVDI